MSDIQNFIDQFNDGELEVKKYFNDYQTFFSILKKRGLLGDLDPIRGSGSEDWQNEYLLWLYDNDKPKYYFWVEKLLNDIEIDSDTYKVYWVGPRQDLADLFCDNRRNELSRETIANLLSSDSDIWDHHWETTDDVYRDVIDELDEKNLAILKNYIIEKLSGLELSPETDEMQLISSEQGHNDYWVVNSENVSRIIDDEESMNSLLGDELSDLKSELYSIHNSSYNNAYEEEIYDNIWKELQDYFDGRGEWITKPHPWKKDVMVESIKIPISDFEGVINDYLHDNKGYGNSGTLEYHGSFMAIAKEILDCLSVYAPDYPSSSKIDKNINMLFSDYI